MPKSLRSQDRSLDAEKYPRCEATGGAHRQSEVEQPIVIPTNRPRYTKSLAKSTTRSDRLVVFAPQAVNCSPLGIWKFRDIGPRPILNR